MQPEADDQDLWEVIVSPDDIKLLTLEQLDDMFRLDVISASTLVRQKGTSSWQRLGVVAGIEDEAPAGGLSDWSDSVPAPAFGVRPNPPSSRAPAFAAAAHPFWNAGAATEALPLLDVDAPILTAPAAEEPALEPPSFDALTRAEPMAAPPAPFRFETRSHAPRRSPLASGLVIATAVIGALWALHRNDMLRVGAVRLGLLPKYIAFEQTSLGKPGFGTPRALEAFLTEIGDSPTASSAAAVAGAAPPPETTAKAASNGTQAPKPTAPAGDATKAVSLDALPVLTEKTATPQSSPAPPAARAPAAPAHAEPAPARKAAAPSEKITLDETPAKPKKPENPLQAAIREAMDKQNKKK